MVIKTSNVARTILSHLAAAEKWESRPHTPGVPHLLVVACEALLKRSEVPPEETDPLRAGYTRVRSDGNVVYRKLLKNGLVFEISPLDARVRRDFCHGAVSLISPWDYAGVGIHYSPTGDPKADGRKAQAALFQGTLFGIPVISPEAVMRVPQPASQIAADYLQWAQRIAALVADGFQLAPELEIPRNFTLKSA